MLRVSFCGDGLRGFAPVAPDQQCKLFFPKPGQGRPVVPQMPAGNDVPRWHQSYLAIPEAQRPWMRSFTVRRHHPDRQEIDVDFVLHETAGGPASRWVTTAKQGAVLGMLGPAASHFRNPQGHDWRLLAGDETALPAIGATVESLAPTESAVVYAEVAGPPEEQYWTTDGDVEVHWLHRGGSTPEGPNLLLDAVRAAQFRDGRIFAWVAGEASTVRGLRRHLVTDRGIDKNSIAFTGYWRRHLTEDDPPITGDTQDEAEATAEFVDEPGTGQ